MLVSSLSEAHHWLTSNTSYVQPATLLERLNHWNTMNPFQVSELIHILHLLGPAPILSKLATNKALYESAGPRFSTGVYYPNQAHIALIGLGGRPDNVLRSLGFQKALLAVLNAILAAPVPELRLGASLAELVPEDDSFRKQLQVLVEQLGRKLREAKADSPRSKASLGVMRSWWRALEHPPNTSGTPRRRPAQAKRRSPKSEEKRR